MLLLRLLVHTFALLFTDPSFASLLARVDVKTSSNEDDLVVVTTLRSLTFLVSVSATLAAFRIFLSVSVDVAFNAR